MVSQTSIKKLTEIVTPLTLNLEIKMATSVGANELTTLPTSNCGSSSLTFGSFFTALMFIETVCTKQYPTGALTFVFADGDHYISIDHDNYKAKESDPDFVFEFLRNTNYDVTIKYIF